MNKILRAMLFPLFPDAEDIMGKQVLLKVDSGPWHFNPTLLARLQLLGFILYPGCPNTTSVTQERDKNYRPIKTCFTCNLDLLTQQIIKNKQSLSMQLWLVRFLAFGEQILSLVFDWKIVYLKLDLTNKETWGFGKKWELLQSQWNVYNQKKWGMGLGMSMMTKTSW